MSVEAQSSEAVIDEIRKHFSWIRTPSRDTPVYKEECMFTFDTPESEGGLYVSLHTFQAFSHNYVSVDHQKTGNPLYLHIKWTKVIDEDEEMKEESATVNKPTKLAIGTAEGFQVEKEKFHFDKEYQIVVLPSFASIKYPHPDLPVLITNTVEEILAVDDAVKTEQIEQWEAKAVESKYARNLVQLDNGIKISPNPKEWKCYDSGMTENLWLNLSTGVIGSGRRNFDGSGGTGAALKHFEDTGRKYPLVVKLGTITPSGADVYSYAEDENDMVEDPLLAEHLAHWGINMMQMKKTEKTMAELDIDINLSRDLLSQDGEPKEQLLGAGYIGLHNLGNSCYCNSLYQVLFSLQGLHQRYVEPAENFIAHAPSNSAIDVTMQLMKLGVGLNTERYLEQEAITPKMIKTLLGQGHPEFSTNRQQDVLEYYQHVLNRIERADRARNEVDKSIVPLFQYSVETRTQCSASNQVRYTYHNDNVLSLTIPTDLATNKADVDAYQAQQQNKPPGDATVVQPVRLHVPFSTVIEHFAGTETLNDFYSTATRLRGSATKTVRLQSFPQYLVIHLRRYTLSEDWTPKKLDAEVPMPEELNLEMLRGLGLQGNEVELKEASDQESGAAPVPDTLIVNQLLDMGFSGHACERAALAVNNSSYEEAANWLMEHIGDSDINDPIPSSQNDSNAPPASATVEVDPEMLGMLLSMGIDASHAEAGLRACGGDIERAVDWCFSHEPSDAIADAGNSAGNDASANNAAAGVDLQAKGEYDLHGIISHLGSNTGSGHYICHIKKNGTWVIFNDNRVFESKDPPLSAGYIYVYKRKA